MVRKRPGFQERVNAGLRRHWSDPAARQAQTDRLNERYKDPEARAKCAAVPKGGKLPAEWVANISAGKRASGYSPSEETRRKISETLMARGDPWAKAREAKARKATAASE